MIRHFKHGDFVYISLQTLPNNALNLCISSDYRYSNRKGIIGFSDSLISEIKDELKRCWKKTKTKKLLSVVFYFEEIDYYDNMIDVYKTPVFSMIRGNRVPNVSYQSHGSIPKEWGAVLNFKIDATSKITPLMEIVDVFFNANFKDEERKKLKKMFKGILTGKEGFDSFTTPEEY